jgi:hypothetical protein
MNKPILDLSILDRIDWKALHRIFQINNWRWQIRRHHPHVPSSGELYECVKELIGSLNLQPPRSQMGSGRLTVYRLDDVIRVWVGSDVLRAGCRFGFWAHQATAELEKLEGNDDHQETHN